MTHRQQNNKYSFILYFSKNIEIRQADTKSVRAQYSLAVLVDNLLISRTMRLK